MEIFDNTQDIAFLEKEDNNIIDDINLANNQIQLMKVTSLKSIEKAKEIINKYDNYFNNTLTDPITWLNDKYIIDLNDF